MKTKFIPLVTACLLLGCGLTTDQKIAQLNDQRAQVIADLHRQKAECQAQAIEFAGDRNVVEACVQSVATMADVSASVIESIDKRIADLRRQ